MKLQTGTQLNCFEQLVAICYGCSTGRAASVVPWAVPLPTGLSGAAMTLLRWHRAPNKPSGRHLAPLCVPAASLHAGRTEPPYLMEHPSARSHLEGMIPLRSRTPASTKAPAGSELWGFIPVSPPNPP